MRPQATTPRNHAAHLTTTVKDRASAHTWIKIPIDFKTREWHPYLIPHRIVNGSDRSFNALKGVCQGKFERFF